MTRSVPAVKADAARTLFTVNCSELVWAVIDSGIDATHFALQQRDGKALAREAHLRFHAHPRHRHARQPDGHAGPPRARRTPHRSDDRSHARAEDAAHRGRGRHQDPAPRRRRARGPADQLGTRRAARRARSVREQAADQPRHPRGRHPRRRRAGGEGRGRATAEGHARRGRHFEGLGRRHVPRHPALRLPRAGADAQGNGVRDHRRAPVHPLHQRAQQLHHDPRREPEPLDSARRPQLRLRTHADLQRVRAPRQQRRRRRGRGRQSRLPELRDQRGTVTRATRRSASPTPATPTA